jgi:adenosylhomocysteine nucleosidase
VVSRERLLLSMAILYVASESMELEPFAERLTGLRKLKWPIDYAYEGIWEGRRLMLAANGAGPRLAGHAVEIAIRSVTAAELSASKLEAIVSTGFCGALDPALRESQIVVATGVMNAETQEKFTATSVTGTDNIAATGVIVTQDRVAQHAAEKSTLYAAGAVAVDMEAAAVAARAKRAGLPFACIKVVSDRADESFGVDLNRMRSPDGRIRRGKISYYALTHPKVIPELLRLKRRTEAAAKVLGEFLVNCRINSEPNSPPPE